MIFGKCCKLRTFAFTIGILFLLVQTAFLILSFFMMRDIEGHVQNILDWLSDRGVTVENRSDTGQAVFPTTGRLTGREYIIRKSGDYLAIPITINVVLIISDTLLIWASGARNRILIWPWMIIHFLEFLFFIAALIFAMIIVPEPWFKVVIFLIGCPIIVLLGFFLFVVKCFYNVLRDVSVKKAVAAVYQNGTNPNKLHNHPINPPATVYKPNPHHWDQPVPVWAVRPPTSAWDPDYLQKYDPRYTRHGRRPRGLRRSDRPVELPDGTMVIPIDDEEEDEDPKAAIDKESSNEIAVANFDEDDEEEDSFENAPESTSHTQGSVCSLSTKFGRQNLRSGLKNHDAMATVTSSSYAPVSEDRSSIISLSDKYRQQDEVEIFHEQFLSPPPEPIRPGQVSTKRYAGSSSTKASSNLQQNDSFRENFKL